MCTGIELLGLAGAGMSAAGSMIGQSQARKQAQAQANARNNELKRTLAKNDPLAEQSRQTFNDRLKQADAENIKKQDEEAVAQREADATKTIDEMPSIPAAVPLAGSTPDVVGNDLVARINKATGESKAQAGRQAALGGVGDSWLEQGFADQATGRDLSQQQNFAAGNMALLPYQQDFAEQRATKPVSPLAGLLEGFGGMLGSVGGSGGMVPKKSYTSPYKYTNPGLY